MATTEEIKKFLESRLQSIGELQLAGIPQDNGKKDLFIKSNVPNNVADPINTAMIHQVIEAVDMVILKRGGIEVKSTGYDLIAQGYHYDVDANHTQESIIKAYREQVNTLLKNPEKIKDFVSEVTLQKALNDPKIPRQDAQVSEPTAPTFIAVSPLSDGVQRA